MTNQEITKIANRANKITAFTFTNQFETEASWLSKVMRKYISTNGKPKMSDESEIADLWFTLLSAHRTVEDVKAETK